MNRPFLGAILSALLAAPLGCRQSRTELPAAPPPADAQAPQHVAGELLVKLTPEAGAIVEAALEAGQPPAQTGVAWFDALNARYGTSRIERVFPRQTGPPHTYKLTLRLDADLLQAAAEYRRHQGVVYAQPNLIATVQ